MIFPDATRRGDPATIVDIDRIDLQIKGRWLPSWVAMGLSAIGVLVAALPGCRPAPAPGSVVEVFVAASIHAPLVEIAATYEQQHGIRIRLNPAATSTLARQIEAGAAADVFIAADPSWVERLRRSGHLQPRTSALAGNTLVVATRGRVAVEATPLSDVLASQAGRIATGDPTHVPLGRYAQQALTAAGVWDAVSSRCVFAADAGSARRLVERGEVEIGILYATDAAASSLMVLVSIDPALHDEIAYVGALAAGASPDADKFLEYLRGADAAQAVFDVHGFTLPVR